MAQVDEVIYAAWVIPVETDEVLQDHAVAVDSGKIVDILPAAEARTKYAPKTETTLPTQALMPGFVNAHTHTPMVYFRGVSDDIPLKEWLEGTIWPLEGQLVGHEFVKEGAELAILEMILSGTTTFNEMYWFPEGTCEAVVATGIRAAIGMIAIEFPFGSYGSGPDEYLQKGEAAKARFAGEDRISWTVSLHAPYTVSDGTFEKAKALSDRLDVPVHIHLHETQNEVDDSKAQNREGTCHLSDQQTSPVENLRRMGLVNKRLVAVHMNAITDEEIKWLGDAEASVVHCPSSGLKLASGFCRVHDYASAGVNVAIGTDGASSNNTLDMMAEMKLAAILAKAVSKNATVVPARTALRMATLNGAKALGIDGVTGSLKVGKAADLIAVDFSCPAAWPAPSSAMSPGFDPVTHIVYSSSRDQVTDVWVQGRRLLEARRPLTIDVPAVRANADKWGAKITEVLRPAAASS